MHFILNNFVNNHHYSFVKKILKGIQSDPFRLIVADMVAMVVFCTITNMFVEILISKMSFGQSFYARLIAIPVNALIAKPYGSYRDFLLHRVTLSKTNSVVNIMINIFAYVTLLTPIYILIILYAGANMHQVITAAAGNVVLSICTGGIYGYFLDYCRRMFYIFL